MTNQLTRDAGGAVPYHVTNQLTRDAGGAVSQEEDGRESGKSWEAPSTSGRKQSPNF